MRPMEQFIDFSFKGLLLLVGGTVGFLFKNSREHDLRIARLEVKAENTQAHMIEGLARVEQAVHRLTDRVERIVEQG